MKKALTAKLITEQTQKLKILRLVLQLLCVSLIMILISLVSCSISAFLVMHCAEGNRSKKGKPLNITLFSITFYIGAANVNLSFSDFSDCVSCVAR